MVKEWTAEHIQTIKNLCDISFVLISVGKEELLPTILEYLLYMALQVNEDECVANGSQITPYEV